jgi:thioredoxin-like negative regulator of GroEL
MQVQKVTAEELEVAIQSRDRPLVIDFYATWCGPCLLLANELEQVIFIQWCMRDWVRVN